MTCELFIKEDKSDLVDLTKNTLLNTVENESPKLLNDRIDSVIEKKV